MSLDAWSRPVFNLNLSAWRRIRGRHPEPIDRELDIAIQNIISQQMSAKEAMQRAQQNALRALQQAGIKL